MDFKTLIETHKDQVSKMDAKKIMPGTAYKKLQECKLELESAESESEKQEASKVLKKAEAGLKKRVLQSIINRSYKEPDQYFFAYLKGYLEYKNLNDKIATPQPHKKTELTLKQVALLYIYKGEFMPRDAADNIAKEYGHTSGQRLNQHYSDYHKDTDRKPSEKKRKDKSLMKDIEKIITHLPEDKKAKPQKEVELLKNAVENNY